MLNKIKRIQYYLSYTIVFRMVSAEFLVLDIYSQVSTEVVFKKY